jgi:hypothetical protein
LPDPGGDSFENKHGTKCHDLEQERIPHFCKLAEEIHEEDWTELDEPAARRLHAEMDGICKSVASLFRLTDVALAARDQSRSVFVGMPRGRRVPG